MEKEDLRQNFEQFGTIRDVWIARNPPGFGFVTYTNPDDAEKAIRDGNGMEIRGERVTVELARPRVGCFSSLLFCRENRAVIEAVRTLEAVATTAIVITDLVHILEAEEVIVIILAPALIQGDIDLLAIAVALVLDQILVLDLLAPDLFPDLLPNLILSKCVSR